MQKKLKNADLNRLIALYREIDGLYFEYDDFDIGRLGQLRYELHLSIEKCRGKNWSHCGNCKLPISFQGLTMGNDVMWHHDKNESSNCPDKDGYGASPKY